MTSRYLGAARPAPMGENRDESVHFAVELQLLSNLAADHLEGAAEVVDRKAGHARNQPIRDDRRQPATHEFILPVLPPAVHEIVALGELVEHHRDVGGIVL